MQARNPSVLPPFAAAIVEGFALLDAGCHSEPDVVFLPATGIAAICDAPSDFLTAAARAALEPNSAGAVAAAVSVYSRSVLITGYRFRTATTSPAEFDPVRWVVEIRGGAAALNWSGEERWAIAGASGLVSGAPRDIGPPTFRPQISYLTPTARGVWVEVHNHASRLVAATGAVDIATTSGFGGMLAATLAGSDQAVRWAWVLMFAALAIGYAGLAAGNFSEENSRGFIAAIIESVSMLLFSLGGILFERSLPAYFFTVGAAAVAATFLAPFAYGWAPGDLLIAFTNTVSYGYLPIMAFSIAVLAARRRALRTARKLIGPDVVRYELAWSHLLGSQERAHLAELAAIARQLRFRCGGRLPLQLNRLHQAQRDDMSLQSGGVDPSRPLVCLHQLYCQAVCLRPVLLSKVRRWALQHGGSFRTYGADTHFLRFDEAIRCSRTDPEDPSPISRIRWAKVKALERAVEKLARSYSGDVARLVDVCRQAIIFEQCASLSSCLAAIGDDPDIVLVRVKNRLDPDYNPEESSGYRDVSLNLRVVTAESRLLGVETHVCEVQLMLRRFAELKSDSGHRHYVQFRNLRGE